MNLYWALLLTGILLLGLIWIHYRHTRGPDRSPPDPRSAVVPHSTLVASREGQEVGVDELQQMGGIRTDSERVADASVNSERGQEEIELQSPKDQAMLQLSLELESPCSADQVCLVLEKRGLEQALDGLYARMASGGALYYVANGTRSDGSLTASRKAQEDVIHLMFFTQLPLHVPGREAFQDMLQVAEEASAALGGTLRDGHGELLSRTRADAVFQRASEFGAELKQEN